MSHVSAWLLSTAIAVFCAHPLWAQGDTAPANPDMADMAGMDHSAHEPMGDDDAAMPMTGALGPYGMTREASGTSWQPDSTPHMGWHFTADDWRIMVHGYANLVHSDQGGPRGDDKTFSSSMMMVMANRSIGERGTLGLRAMVSLDPLMGKSGYPLLFATGETADGQTGLVDRQHPHDLFMELSASYSIALSERSSVFFYAGLPGEPALGPTAFMHRTSAADSPEAPITHHWLDSTHITFGVVTAGVVVDRWKLEVSGFRGREPDQYRYNIETPKLDSVSGRLSFNPTPQWSLQASVGHLTSPEQLHPEQDETLISVSASYTKRFDNALLATTFAWGHKIQRSGDRLDGILLESALTWREHHTIFGRLERVDENELFDHDDALADRVFTVNKLSLGYAYDMSIAKHLGLGLGGLVSKYAYPKALDGAYGSSPTSFMVFARLKLL